MFMLNEYLDRPPAGWFALDVMKAGSGRKWDWVSIWIDVPPDGHCTPKLLGPHPRQAQKPGCRLGRAGRHDRHAALAEPRCPPECKGLLISMRKCASSGDEDNWRVCRRIRPHCLRK
jgi:hypothetical protein